VNDLFEEITNAIAVLIKDDAELTAYCNDKLGSAMNPIDNSITHESHQGQVPFFVITKGEEEHFFNRGTASGTKSSFPCSIVFFGKFAGEQVDNKEFALLDGTKTTVNGITTYTPSDTMRKIARLAGNLVNKQIDCKIPQLRVESFTVFSEGFYDRENGAVGSILSLNIYQENNGYGN
jgi:hypothetical protein